MLGTSKKQDNPSLFNTPPVFNTNTSHPLIPNSQEYMYYKKYVSIHSEDRDMLKFPSSSEFEIMLPEDMTNVATLRLSEWAFPSNYNTFSVENNNVVMTFKIANPYNPNINGVDNVLVQQTFKYFFENSDTTFSIKISSGFYNPEQMVTELTNRFNTAITAALYDNFTSQSTNSSLTQVERDAYLEAIQLLTAAGGYTNFVVVYNNVDQKIWFGNTSDGFILTNSTQINREALNGSLLCVNRSHSPDFSNWGLPANLGLSRCDVEATTATTLSGDVSVYNSKFVPRFYYGDVSPGDNGFWLVPNPSLTNSNVYWLESTYKINLMGPAYMYMELEGQNCIDETAPYNVSEFTLKTNETNGIVNSAFAKIAIPSTPLSQWFDYEQEPYKFYYPPAERIRKLKLRLRYHDGQLVNFGVFNFTFTIEFIIQMPQILRKTNSVSYNSNTY
jgi:hypothetical protein